MRSLRIKCWRCDQCGNEGNLILRDPSMCLFIEDEATDPVTLLKKQIQFGFGGAWLGQRFTKQNMSFVEVEEALLNKNTKIMVACGEGISSAITPHHFSEPMVAIEELRKPGYVVRFINRRRQMKFFCNFYTALTPYPWIIQISTDFESAC